MLRTTPRVSGLPRRGKVRLDRFDGSRCFRASRQVGRSPGVMGRAKRGPSRASLAAFWRVDVDALRWNHQAGSSRVIAIFLSMREYEVHLVLANPSNHRTKHQRSIVPLRSCSLGMVEIKK